MPKIPQFKVWDNNSRQWLYPNYYFDNVNGQGKGYGGNIVVNQNNIVFLISPVSGMSIFDNIEICRFIGLFDKNNMPIYENSKIQVWFDYKKYVGKVICDKCEFIIDGYEHLRLKHIPQQAFEILE